MRHRSVADIAERSAPSTPADSLAGRMNALASLAATASGGGACLILWQRATDSGSAHAPADPGWEPALWAILGMLSRQGAGDGRSHGAGAALNATFRMSAAEVSLRCGRALPGQMRLEAYGVASSASPTAHASIVILAPQGTAPAQGEALLHLVRRQALAEIELSEEAASLWFWRDRAATATERLAAERASARRERGGDARIERALGALVKLGPRERWARLGRLFASSGPFAAWAVATAASDANASPGVAAASMRDAGEALVIEGRSALAETIRRRVVFVRSAAGRRVGDFCEDRWFREFADYLCVPFEGGAIALASARPLETAARERAMALAARVGAVCAGWTASEQARRMRELARTLGLRLFGAAEAERARIARDLHDDHAQMLAAARLALDGEREQARAIFGRLEKELRRRLNELRPAELGKRTLAAALRAELDRLAAGGIAARLKGAAAANRLPAAVRQVCYRAAREALANVVRHADATRVEVLIERDGPLVRLVVSDNGRGIDRRTSPHDGAGLGGLGERLQFVGGAMRIESKRGLTRLIAEIPLA